MLRFATSPTGDMHIGDLRVAIFNYIVSQQRDEDLLVRIEDMDKEKNVEGKDQEVLDLLALFGIEYTQVIYQSESVRFHSAMALQLMHEKRAFSCFCSPEWIEKKQKESQVANTVYKYDDACRNLPAELVIDNTSPFTIRITKPDTDLSVDSFIILHQDKTPTYNFASAVDDMLNDISIIIRSEEHIKSTPKQEHIRTSLSYEKKIEYVHLPLLLNSDTLSVKALLEDGFLPEAILNYLISTGYKTPFEIFTLKDAKEWFDLSEISKSPTRIDMDILRDINKKHLKNLDAKELSRYVGFADAEIGQLARIYLEEAGTTQELKAKIAPIFSERIVPQEFLEQTNSIAKIIKAAPHFEEYEEFKKYIMKESGLEGENFSIPLRILLTNAVNGPDISMIYNYLKNYIGEIIK